MSESTQTSRADLCDVKRCSFLFTSHRSACEVWLDSDVLENFSRNGGYVVLARSHSIVMPTSDVGKVSVSMPYPNVHRNLSGGPLGTDD